MALWAAIGAPSAALGGPHERPLYKSVWSPKAVHTRWGGVDRRLHSDYRTLGGHWVAPQDLSNYGSFRPRAMAAFVFGFWILDVANNMTQGLCRALLANLTGNPPYLSSEVHVR
jgi:hypothetical protein